MPLIKKLVEIELSPEKIAELFCNMDSREMVDFFNSVHEISEQWQRCFHGQMWHIVREPNFNEKTKYLFDNIGSYKESLK